MHMLRRFILVLFLICPLMIGGCSQGETETDLLADNDESLIYEETISPNEDYVSSQDDIVYYTIRFYQDEDDKITVTADSNDLLFEKMEYEVPADVRISKENINIDLSNLDLPNSINSVISMLINNTLPVNLVISPQNTVEVNFSATNSYLFL